MLKKSIFFLSIFSTLLLTTSCSDDDPVVDPPVQANAVRLATSSTLGKILTDAKGMTLYFFSNDTKDNSECNSEQCVATWPIFYAENLTLDAGLNKEDFATITRADGTKQTTYKKWPLYYFVNDAAAGDTKGENVNEIWFVAKPDYSLMYVNAQLIGHDGKNYKEDYSEGEAMTKYIVDIQGRTLYGFANDKKDKNNFTKPDFSNNSVWPIAEISLDQIPSVLNKGDFGTIDVFGRTQLTYKGWPLYYFGGTDTVKGDETRGDNRGISFPAPKYWPIVNTNTPMAPAN
ncbi:hypothetical protein [Tenacibaculum maritimum]|uniref:hypothetical protein n=1 Tax=Tenacibaculum maritimum TaxID=107401 RepID=UPI0012E65989|nr:hypothetical protein [Tenacibaculum maritimum]CAA0177007.1 Putative lipoprotein [Tenacibaculum maritimum]